MYMLYSADSGFIIEGEANSVASIGENPQDLIFQAVFCDIQIFKVLIYGEHQSLEKRQSWTRIEGLSTNNANKSEQSFLTANNCKHLKRMLP